MTIKRLLKKGKKVFVEFEDYERIILSYEIVLKYAIAKDDVLTENRMMEISG